MRQEVSCQGIHRHLFLHEFSHYLNLRNTRLAYPKWYVEGFTALLEEAQRVMRDNNLQDKE